MKVIIHGINGSMGRVLAKTAEALENIHVVAGIDIQPEAFEHPFPVFSSLSQCDIQADILIDFSVHQAVPKLVQEAVSKKLPVVIATTGLSKDTLEQLKHASKKIPVFQAANMSLGVNLMYQLAQHAAAVFGSAFDIEIIERHHNKKMDAPSGTAYAIANAINKVFQEQKSFVFGRYGNSARRAPNEIGIHAVRGGTIAGEHTVVFAGQDELLELTHTAHSKQIFASGALIAAGYLVDKPCGFYSMQDIMTEASTISSLYADDNQAMITLIGLPIGHHIAWQLFHAIGAANINIDMISQSAPSSGKNNISFTLPVLDLNQAQKIIELELERTDISAKIRVLYEMTKLSIEGVGMEYQSGVAARVFQSMASHNIEIISISTSETKMTCIIEKHNKELAVSALKQEFNI